MAHQVFLMIYFPEFNEYLLKKKNQLFCYPDKQREQNIFFIILKSLVPLM